MKLEKNSRHPLYYQLKQVIKEKINSEYYKRGDQLPSEIELSEEYGVSRITTRRTIKELVEEGILSKQQGKGTFVNSPKIKRELISMSGFSDYMMESGQTPVSQIISNTTISADIRLSNVLDVPEKDDVLELVRLLFINNEPCIIQSIYFPLKRFPDLEKLVDDSVSTYQILKENYNVSLSTIKRHLNVNLASSEVADILKCEKHECLFELETTAYDMKKTPIHNTISLYPANKVTFTISSGGD